MDFEHIDSINYYHASNSSCISIASGEDASVGACFVVGGTSSSHGMVAS